MKNNINPESWQNISVQYGFIEKVIHSSKYNEILLKCDEALVVLSMNADLIGVINLSWEEKLISATRLSDGWEALINHEGALSVVQIPSKKDDRIFFDIKDIDANTAIWSPCEKLIAVGDSSSAQLTVLDKEKGKVKWTEGLELMTESELISRPSLSVVEWSSCGQKIITYAEYLSAKTIIIWDAENGKIDSIID